MTRPTLFGGPLDGEVLLDRPPGSVLFVTTHAESFVASITITAPGEYDVYIRPHGEDFHWLGCAAFAERPADVAIEHLWRAVIRRAPMPEGL